MLQDVPVDAERTALRQVIERALKDDGARKARGLENETAHRLGALLTPYLGPIAPMLVKRHAAEVADTADLAALLAELITNPPERQQFLADARTLL